MKLSTIVLYVFTDAQGATNIQQFAACTGDGTSANSDLCDSAVDGLKCIEVTDHVHTECKYLNSGGTACVTGICMLPVEVGSTVENGTGLCEFPDYPYYCDPDTAPYCETAIDGGSICLAQEGTPPPTVANGGTCEVTGALTDAGTEHTRCTEPTASCFTTETKKDEDDVDYTFFTKNKFDNNSADPFSGTCMTEDDTCDIANNVACSNPTMGCYADGEGSECKAIAGGGGGGGANTVIVEDAGEPCGSLGPSATTTQTRCGVDMECYTITEPDDWNMADVPLPTNVMNVFDDASEDTFDGVCMLLEDLLSDPIVYCDGKTVACPDATPTCAIADEPDVNTCVLLEAKDDGTNLAHAVNIIAMLAVAIFM